jgi:hypothetical protein
MSKPPLQHSYLHAIYSMTIDGRTVECSFVKHRFARGNAAPASLPPTWAFITARNPMSRPLDEPANQKRDDALDGAVGKLGERWLPASSRAPDGSWLEPGRIILECSREVALALARQFDQRAVVWTHSGRTGTLDRRTEAWVVRPTVWS